MMNENDLSILKNYIKYIKTTSTNEHIFRCPVCGDSVKPYHGHFYVSQEGKYICFKCGVKGNNVFRLILKYFDVSPEDKVYLMRKLFDEKKRTTNQNEQYIENIDSEIFNSSIEFERILKKKKNSFERNVIKTLFLPYLISRVKPHIDLMYRLLNNGIIIPFFSDVPVEYEKFKPSKLLNRIYFKFDIGVYQQRKVNDQIDHLDNKKTKYKKYIFYTPKNLQEISTFRLSNSDTTDVLFLVEGVFDVIKLYGFLENEIENITVSNTNGKNLKKSLIVKLVERYSPKVVIYIPDKDVKKKEILENLNTIHGLTNGNVELMVGVLKNGFKDVGEFTSIDDLRNNLDMVDYGNYVFGDIRKIFDKKIVEV